MDVAAKNLDSNDRFNIFFLQFLTGSIIFLLSIIDRFNIFLLLIIDKFNHDEHDADDCHDADDDDAKNVDWTLCLLLV